jgi:polar amino acid transport system substrate-binding protein
MARRDGPISSWADVASQQVGKRWLAGALTGSAAYRYLEREFSDQVELVGFDGNTNAMERVRAGALDLTLQDDCIAIYYADRFPELRLVGRAVDEGYYVALVDKREPRLHAALNDALGNIIRDGRLHELYDRWDMSGKAQMLALRDTGEIAAARSQSFSEIVADNGWTLLKAAGMTVLLSVVSMPLAIGIGILVAIGRLYGPRWLGWILGWYVEILRGTPLLLQLLALFYLLPKLGLTLPAMVAAIAGLAINYSAYEAEIYRAGMQAIPRGQMEAALALGMTRAQSVRRIILPQAFRIVIPPVTNDFIALFKDTSVCSVITVVELTKQYSILALSTGAIVELAAITAVLYLLMSYPLSLFARYSERRLAR